MRFRRNVLNVKIDKKMKTITLEPTMTFADALQCLIDGKCIGIRPKGNSNFIVKYHPRWMIQTSTDFVLCWNHSVKDGIGDHSIRTDQYLGTWQLVIIDSNDLSENIKQRFILEDISKLDDNA